MALLTEISLCTGYDGIGLGLRAAGLPVRTICYVERESFAVANLVSKIEKGRLDDAPIWSDLKHFPSELFAGKVDIIHGGYPCQPFSHAGKRRGTEDERHLWPYIREIVKTIRPLWCFFENVEGHITLGLREVLADLVGLGYRVENDRGEPTWGIFSASEVGAPHQRKRVFILAKLADPESIGSGTFGADDELRRTEDVGCCGKQSGELDHPFGNEHIGAKPGGNGIPEGLPRKHRQDYRAAKELGGTRCVEREELAYPHIEGLEKRRQLPIRTEQEYSMSTGECCLKWPSRPGQPQHRWEPPRTIMENPGYEDISKEDVGEAVRNGGFEYADEVTGKAGQVKSPLGGNSDGRSDWLDKSYGETTDRASELMLLGNGVVPTTAERAWRILMRRFEKDMPVSIEESEPGKAGDK